MDSPPAVPRVDTRKQVTYPDVAIDVQRAPEGHLVLVITAPGEILVFPMGVEYAQTLGRKLIAPSVIPANGT